MGKTKENEIDISKKIDVLCWDYKTIEIYGIDGIADVLVGCFQQER